MMVFLALVFCILLVYTDAHSALLYPFARSLNTGNKGAPCGAEAYGSNGFTDIAPGPLTITIYEDLFHTGAPWRFALSDESGTDSGFNECVLLNHIPHSANRNAAGAYYYRFTVDIPDVKCDGCTLQVINVMTDKIGAGNSCNFDPLFKNAAAGECFSNYYSCADVKITGTIPRSSLQCAQPNNWPYLLETARTGTTAQPLVYHNAEVAEWTDGWLKTLPASFQQPAGLGATILKADVPTPGSNTGDVVVTSAPSTGGSTSTADTTSAPASSGSTTTYAAVAVVGMGAVAAYLLTTRKKPTPNGVMPNQQQMQAMQGSNYAYGP